MSTFGYYINRDERADDFFADVRSTDNQSIFEIHQEGDPNFLEDIGMRHKDDVDRLQAHLVDLGIINPGDRVVSSADFEFGSEDLEDEDNDDDDDISGP